MTVSIELNAESGIVTGHGTKVFTSCGTEIKGVTSITVSIKPDEVVMATIEVALDAKTNLDNIALSMSEKTINKLTEHQEICSEKKDHKWRFRGKVDSEIKG